MPRKRLCTKPDHRVTDLARSMAKRRRLERLIRYRERNEARTPFQYDVAETHILFRVRLKRACRRGAWRRLVSLMQIAIEDGGGVTGIAFCEGVRYEQDIVQLRIARYPRCLVNPTDAHPLLGLLYARAERLLMRLPRRSAAALEELPMLGSDG